MQQQEALVIKVEDDILKAVLNGATAPKDTTQENHPAGCHEGAI
jgi:hypothetical protein